MATHLEWDREIILKSRSPRADAFFDVLYRDPPASTNARAKPPCSFVRSTQVIASLVAACAACLALATLPTLDAIGRGAAQLSLASVFGILGLCLAASPEGWPQAWPARPKESSSLELGLGAAAAAGTVGYAMTTTKLLLNVRLEMADPSKARRALKGLSLIHI